MNNQSEEVFNIPNADSYDPRNELDSEVKQKMTLILWKRFKTEYLEKNKRPTPEERAAMVAEVYAQFTEELAEEEERIRAVTKPAQ